LTTEGKLQHDILVPPERGKLKFYNTTQDNTHEQGEGTLPPPKETFEKFMVKVNKVRWPEYRCTLTHGQLQNLG
jgi:hypothetical protein